MKTSRDFDRAVRIFEQACELPPEERAAFLEHACTGDSALQAEVESLLAHDRAGTTFDAMVDGGMVEALADSLGTVSRDGALNQVGPYRIIRRIGEGGMGEVFEAEQESPRRRVALKVIRSGQLSPNIVRRFEHEAFVLGQLQHPGIAHIYESGVVSLDGRDQPFFAMEYIDGVRITTHADGHGLDKRRRLALFVHVCDAVQHAHQKGIIHRDLKPGNILVVDREPRSGKGTSSTRNGTECDNVGQPKVLDFGVARMTDGDMQAITMQTDAGQLVGTLAYMSPEQVAGDSSKLDTRCDIYALGVVLYQLLTDRMPLDVSGRSIAEAARIITDDDPTPASMIDRSLRGDIETILIKALDKDPARRYATAAELAADVRRYLRDEPIAARPASAIYNIRKFARRNRGLVGGLVATFLVLLLGAAGTTIGLLSALRANDELARTNSTLAAANLALEQTNNDLKKVSEFQSSQFTGIDVPALGQHIRTDLLDSAAEVEPPIESVLADVNFTDLARSALDAFIFSRGINTINNQFSDQPMLQARLLQDVATVQRQLGILNQAVAPQRQAMNIRRRELGNDHPDTLKSVEALGQLQQDLGEYDLAEKHYKEAWTANRRLHGDSHLRSLAGQSNMGSIEYAQGNLEAAAELTRTALDSYEALGNPIEALATMSVLGSILVEQSKFEEAEQVLRETLRRRRSALGGDDSMTLRSMTNLARLLHKIGKYKEGQALTEESLATYKRLLGDDHPETVEARMLLGDLLTARGKLSEAEPILRDALAAQRRLLGNAHPLTLGSVNNLAALLDQIGEYAEAEALFRESLAGHRRLFGDEHFQTLRAIGNLGFVLNLQGKSAEAEPYYRQALAGFQKVFGKEHQLTLSAMGNLGAFLSKMGKHAEAEPLYYEALEGRRKLLGDDHPSTLNATYNMGHLLLDKGALKDAEPFCEDALAGYQRVGGDTHIGTLFSLTLMAELRMAQNRPADAESFYLIAIERRRSVNGDDSPNTLRAMRGLAEALETQGRWADAEPWRRTVHDSVSRFDPPDEETLSSCKVFLGRTLLRQERHAEAEAILAQSLELHRNHVPETHWRRWFTQGLLGQAVASDQQRHTEAMLLIREAAERIAVPPNASDLVLEYIAATRRRGSRNLDSSTNNSVPATGNAEEKINE